MSVRRRGLVIDDEARVRALVCDLLAKFGCDADEAEDGPTGLTLLLRHRYDLVVTDLKMPGMTGWDVVEAVRARVPAMPIVMVSGFATDDDRERARVAGLTLLEKPFQLAEFGRAITQGLARPRSSEALGSESPPPSSCPVCSRPLASGGTVLWQGDRLVHALCYRDTPRKPLSHAGDEGQSEPETGEGRGSA